MLVNNIQIQESDEEKSNYLTLPNEKENPQENRMKKKTISLPVNEEQIWKIRYPSIIKYIIPHEKEKRNTVKGTWKWSENWVGIEMEIWAKIPIEIG